MKTDNLFTKLFEQKSDLPCADACFAESAGAFEFDDVLSGEIAKIRKIQLLDRDLWKKLVDIFRRDNADGEFGTWKCEYWGKMMRGACFVYKTAPTPDDELYSVLEETVRDLLTTQDELGRICTYTVENEFTGWDIWGRKYVMLGLIYFLGICRDGELYDTVLTALTAHADYITEKIGHGEDQREIAACSGAWDGLNSCSILEPFVLLFNLTKEPRYLEFSEYIASFGGTLHENYFKIALENKTPIASYGQPKAYEMISCFDGLAELSKITGNEDYRQAVINFADRLLKEETTVIGCLGCDSECLNHASVMQSDGGFIPTMEFKGEDIHIMQETCVTVTWMKFLWQLWRMTGDAKYMDAFEISMYNAMSAALKDEIDPNENGGIILPVHSYNPLRHDIRSEIVGGQQLITENSLYGCCVCISSAGFALDTLAAAGHDSNGTIYLNLYRNGRITLGDAVLDIKTAYPLSGSVNITVSSSEGEKNLALRIPEWAGQSDVAVNGDTRTVRSGYCELAVSKGDTITIELPMDVRFMTPDDAADVPTGRDDYICVRRGPIVFALDDTDENEPTVNIHTDTDAVLAKNANIPCRYALTVKTADGRNVTLVDYRSAGQVRGHKSSAWIKIK